MVSDNSPLPVVSGIRYLHASIHTVIVRLEATCTSVGARQATIRLEAWLRPLRVLESSPSSPRAIYSEARDRREHQLSRFLTVFQPETGPREGRPIDENRHVHCVQCNVAMGLLNCDVWACWRCTNDVAGQY